MTDIDKSFLLKEEAPVNIGARIKEARSARGLNRNQFARRVGTSWALVDQWEKGKTIPSTNSLRRIANVLEVTPDQLLGTHEEPLNDGFQEYLKAYLPTDLSAEECRWLRSVPSTNRSTISADGYAAIVRVLRAHRSECDATRDNVVKFTRAK